MTGAERAAALQHRPVRLLLDVEVWLDRNRLPTADGIDGDLLILGAKETKSGEEERSKIKKNGLSKT